MPRILVVEDEVLIRLSLSEWLRSESHEVLEASCGDEALTLSKSILEIDIVITDVQMPGDIDGLGLAERLREVRPELPIILVSGSPLSKPLGSAASAFLMKPYDLAGIAELVTRLVAPSDHAVNAREARK
ncbi:response regulator [Roseococcus sp.]|uniref:response regulator n=1 Tax=Roseococcus sp. TaxID=2109646 RepID=UPI003BA983EB